MSRPKLTKPQIRQRAEEVVDGLMTEHDPEILGVVRQLLAERVEKPTGRRVEPLWPIYKEMHRFLVSGATGKKPIVTKAASMVAYRIEGVAKSTAIETLRKGYPRYRDGLEAERVAEAASETSSEDECEVADRKAATLKRAFEEDVDGWDL